MIHIYTGNGKGKTTAALGLALRATGAGMKVFIGQFVKGMKYHEARIIENRLPEIQLELLGRDCFIEHEPRQEDIDAAHKGWERVKVVIGAGLHDMVVLDELNIALYYKLLPLNEVLEMLTHVPKNMELVITGRYAPEELIKKADLVTSMEEIKHYYNAGVQARKGIEW